MTKRERVLSGMRPSGRLHLGNLAGALQNWIALQREYDCFFFIADWHALTTDYAETGDLQANIREMAADMLAAGLDPERATIFVQSRVPEHAELHLLFSMITPEPWLKRVPTYKEQQEANPNKDLSTYGFLGYPVLQAADILIYKANYVPVGQDQLPHIELTREIARRFNNFYGPVFPEPAAKVTEVPRVRGTDGEKMSKSRNNCIYLAETPEEVTAKVRPMVTDPARKRRSDPGDPDKCPVYDVHKIFTPISVREQTIIPGCTRALFGCLDCKDVLLKHMLPVLNPIREKREELMARPAQIAEVLNDGSARARAVAAATLKEAREAMHLL
ncbi:MAG TPA: tryptophan--tRNA ligase [Candidatus Methylomirabilis sp.]|jgi:tryptophanyl-tRNA synthetase|nr:tryptophan--tRNA ligase [Candidatus Methylomirabilis sp.]